MSCKWYILYWNLSDSKSLQLSGTLLSILAVLLLLLLSLLLAIFSASFSWWSFTRVSVIASLLKTPGLFSIMLLFGWSQLVLRLSTLPIPIFSLLCSFRACQFQVVSQSLSYSVVLLVLWQGLSTCLSFGFFDFYSVVC